MCTLYIDNTFFGHFLLLILFFFLHIIAKLSRLLYKIVVCQHKKDSLCSYSTSSGFSGVCRINLSLASIDSIVHAGQDYQEITAYQCNI